MNELLDSANCTTAASDVAKGRGTTWTTSVYSVAIAVSAFFFFFFLAFLPRFLGLHEFYSLPLCTQRWAFIAIIYRTYKKKLYR